MKTKFITLLLVLAFLPAIAMQVDRSKQPKPGPAPLVKLGTPQIFKLKNGLQVLVVENHKLPKVSASLSINRPPVYEGNKAGLGYLVGELLGTGSKTRSKNDFDEEVDYLGASVSFSDNSFFVSSLSKYFPRVLELASDAMINPNFTQEEFQKASDLLIDGLKIGEKAVDNIAQRIQGVLAYGRNHPAGEFITETSVKNTSLTDVNNYYQKHFNASNAYLMLIGDITLKDAKKLAKNLFNPWKEGAVHSATYPNKDNPAQIQIDFVDMPNAVQSNIAVLNTVPLRMKDRDYHAVIVANKVLGGDFNSYLNMNLREAHGFTYGARSSIRANKYHHASFKAGANVRNAVTDSAVVETLKELKRIKTERVTEETLKNVKATLTGDFIRNVTKPNVVARFSYNQLTRELPQNFYEVYLNNIDKVTTEDVQRVANQYFKLDNARIVVVGKASDVLEGLKKLGYPINYYDKEGNPTREPEINIEMPEGVSVNSVLDNYFKAIGGKEKAASIKTIYHVSEASVQGQTLKFISKFAAPNKYRREVKMGGMTMSKQVFNGKEGLNEANGQKIPLEKEELDKLLSSTLPFEEFGYYKSAVLERIEKVDGKDAYVLKIHNSRIFYDVASGLKVKNETAQKMPDGSEMMQTISYKDYKVVSDGIKMSHKSILTGVFPIPLEFNTIEIKANESIDASEFN